MCSHSGAVLLNLLSPVICSNHSPTSSQRQLQVLKLHFSHPFFFPLQAITFISSRPLPGVLSPSNRRGPSNLTIHTNPSNYTPDLATVPKLPHTFTRSPPWNVLGDTITSSGPLFTRNYSPSPLALVLA